MPNSFDVGNPWLEFKSSSLLELVVVLPSPFIEILLPLPYSLLSFQFIPILAVFPLSPNKLNFRFALNELNNNRCSENLKSVELANPILPKYPFFESSFNRISNVLTLDAVLSPVRFASSL